MGETCRDFLCLSEPLSPLEEENAELTVCNGWRGHKNVLFSCSCNVLSIRPVSPPGTSVIVKGNNRADRALSEKH